MVIINIDWPSVLLFIRFWGITDADDCMQNNEQIGGYLVLLKPLVTGRLYNYETPCI